MAAPDCLWEPTTSVCSVNAACPADMASCTVTPGCSWGGTGAVASNPSPPPPPAPPPPPPPPARPPGADPFMNEATGGLVISAVTAIFGVSQYLLQGS